MKNLRKLYFIALFSLLLAPFAQVKAVDGTRYLVKSNSQFWKKTFNARHDFKDGFTADLNDWQIRFGKILGVSIESVGILQVLPAGPASEIALPSGSKSQNDKEVTSSQRKTISARERPADQTP